MSDSVFVAWRGGAEEVGKVGKVVGGGWNAGSCSALKNPLLIDFKW